MAILNLEADDDDDDDVWCDGLVARRKVSSASLRMDTHVL